MTTPVSKLLGTPEPREGEAVPVFRITSTAVDRERDRILKIRAPTPTLRPPLLWNHIGGPVRMDHDAPAIGRAHVFQEDGQWLMVPRCDRIGALSQEVDDKIKAGTLDACSIGFLPTVQPVPNDFGGLDYPEVELLEVSIVNVPANTHAVRIRSMTPDDFKAFREEQASTLKQINEGLTTLRTMTEEVRGLLGKMAPAEEEPAAETPPPEPPPEDEAKALRSRVAKAFGFTPEQAAALPTAELNTYASHLAGAA